MPLGTSQGPSKGVETSLLFLLMDAKTLANMDHHVKFANDQ